VGLSRFQSNSTRNKVSTAANSIRPVNIQTKNPRTCAIPIRPLIMHPITMPQVQTSKSWKCRARRSNSDAGKHQLQAFKRLTGGMGLREQARWERPWPRMGCCNPSRASPPPPVPSRGKVPWRSLLGVITEDGFHFEEVFEAIVAPLAAVAGFLVTTEGGIVIQRGAVQMNHAGTDLAGDVAGAIQFR